MQGAQLLDQEEQAERSGPARAEEVLPALPDAPAAPRDPLSSPISPSVPLVLVAHGSRHPGVSAALDQLAAAVAAESGPERIDISTAFLDLTEPDLGTVAAALAAAGHERAIVLPLLFTQAFHARVDLPETVRKAAQDTGLDLVTADILGTGGDIEAILVDALTDADVPSDAVVLLYAVGSSDPDANAAVMALASRLGSHRGSWDFAAFATCDPRADEQLGRVERLTVLPLFVSPGLLLNQLETAAADHDVRILPPLGNRLAPVIHARYRAAL